MAGNRKKTKNTPSRQRYHAEGRQIKNKKLRAERHERYLAKWAARKLKKAKDLGRDLCDVCGAMLSKAGNCGRKLAGIHE